MSSKLFTPAKIGSMQFSNRLVRSATQDPFGQKDGTVGPEQIEIHRELAKSGVPFIISAYAYVSPEGRATKIQVGFCEEAHYESQKKILDAVHENGSKIALQLHHAGINTFIKSNDKPLAPTGGMDAPNGAKSCEMTAADMDRICDAYVKAAVKAKEIGFDAIQLHGAHGYLFNQFMDPNFNQRDDEFGGSAENRFRFPKRVAQAVIEAVGPDYPVLVKINSNCAGEADEQYEQDLIYFCKEYEKLGVAAVELSGFNFIALGKKQARNYYLERAKALKAALNIPVIFVGGVRDQENIDEVMDAGLDFIALCRPFICEPNLVEVFKAGETSQCISCSKCFVLWEREGRRCVKHDKPEV